MIYFSDISTSKSPLQINFDDIKLIAFTDLNSGLSLKTEFTIYEISRIINHWPCSLANTVK